MEAVLVSLVYNTSPISSHGAERPPATGMASTQPRASMGCGQHPATCQYGMWPPPSHIPWSMGCGQHPATYHGVWDVATTQPHASMGYGHHPATCQYGIWPAPSHIPWSMGYGQHPATYHGVWDVASTQPHAMEYGIWPPPSHMPVWDMATTHCALIACVCVCTYFTHVNIMHMCQPTASDCTQTLCVT